jgi:hypothetical protein
VYSLPRAPIDRAAFFKELEGQLTDHLYRTRTSDVFANRELRLYSRAGESREEFIARCKLAAEDQADVEAATLRDKVQAKLHRLAKQQRTAESRVRELTVDTKQRVQHEIVAGAGQLLSVFLGGRRGLRSLSGAASRRGVTRRTQERLDTAKGKVEDAAEDMRDRGGAAGGSRRAAGEVGRVRGGHRDEVDRARQGRRRRGGGGAALGAGGAVNTGPGALSSPGAPAARTSQADSRSVSLHGMTDDSVAAQDAALRAMTVEQKLAVAESLRAFAWELTRSVIRQRHPELTEDEVLQSVRAAFGSGST